MPKLKLEVKGKEQRGPHTYLQLLLSEKDGPKSVPLEFTLHNVDESNVDVKGTGMRIVTKEGAPVYLNFGKPMESIP